MRSKPPSCTDCQICDHGTDFSGIEGTGANGVMLVGEASGQMEARDCLPFRPYAPAGSVLERCLRRMNLRRHSFSITNVVRCRPRHDFLENAPWEYGAISQCRSNLDAAIAERKPRCIVPLGGVATRELTGVYGEKMGVTHLMGYVLPLQKDSKTPVLINLHPSYMRRGKASHQGVWSRVIARSLKIAAGTDRNWMWNIDPEDSSTWNTPNGGKLNYWVRPSLDQCFSVLHYLKQNQGLWVAKDLETYESTSIDEDARAGFMDTQIRQFQLSYQPGTGLAIPYDGPFKTVIRDFLELPNQFYGHNWDNFDHKVCRAAAGREGWKYAPPVRCFDTLDMFHHWQPDLPAHLQFAASFIQWPFPWKHLDKDSIEFYGICDVDSDLQLGEYLQKMLKADGVWGRGNEYDATVGYTGQVRELRPVLAGMEDVGMPINNMRRLRLGEDFQKASDVIANRLMPAFPESAKKLEPYKKLPPELRALPERDWDKLFREEDRWKCKCGRANNRMDDERCECSRLQEDGALKAGKWYRYAMREVPEKDPDGNEVHVPRWCYIPEFNPNSRLMVIDYMKAKGHPVPKSKEEDWQGNQKDTTAAKELQRLAAKVGDQFYLDVVEYRGLSKMRGTYVEGFKPGPDGCVHTTFTTSTAIGQTASHNPNTQNFPKLKPTPELAEAMREMVAPKEGKVLTEWDKKSCHALTLGYLAESPRYMRMARLDIHSFVAGHFLNLWNAQAIERETDDELKARFKWLKSDPERKRVRDDQAKHSILGIGNGLRWKGLFERYMEQFPARPCPECGGVGKVMGVRAMKYCPLCAGNGKQSGMAIAKEFENITRAIWPEVFAWQDRVQFEAHDKRQLKTEFGHLRRFYEVKRWDSKMDHGKGGWGHGDQAEESIAYWLANIAFGHIRENMKALHREGLAQKYGMFNNVHDSFMFHFDRELLEEHKREILPVLLAPDKILTNPKVAPGGLVIDVDASWTDRDWAHMKGLFEPEPPRVIYDGQKFTYLEERLAA